ncbi:MAG: GNAT family N-acetyltransferase [Oscillospiraceae bacterium]|nr:GNAT family N-acetyltransferase [Oscillospiraceae bacterium]
MRNSGANHFTEHGVDMLDKTIPYAGLYMCRKAGTPLATSCELPEGYRFALFSDGDEESWAAIETSVLEFDSVFSALLHFKGKFMPYADELRRRCLFIEDAQGEKVATATAWWSDVEGRSCPWLHWVAADPRYQGLGLGKAIVSRVTQLMLEIEGDVDFYLHTQTWSYKAISIYMKNGFQPAADKRLYKDKRDNCRKALKILRKAGKF